MAARILVTGGAGFIGSTIADRFVGAGWDVAVVDDLSSGKRENVPDQARFYPCDVRSAAAAEAVERERPDVLCHHAAQIDVRRSMADPRHDVDVNLGGLVNLLSAAARAGVRHVLFASSGGAAYGETDRIPTPEDEPTRPVSVYGASKAASELFLGVWRAAHGITFSALRYGNVYGPRQDPHGEAGVVAIFAGRLLEGQPCTVNGDGTQTRDYVYVGDVARANLLAAERRHDGALNVGTGVETDVNRIYRVLADAAGVADAAQSTDRPSRASSDGPASTPPRPAARSAGAPEVPLEEGLRRTLEWFRARRQMPDHPSSGGSSSASEGRVGGAERRRSSSDRAAAASAAGTVPFRSSRPRSRRALRASQRGAGASAARRGAGSMAASTQAWAAVRSRALVPNQWRAAASAPNTPFPHSATSR